MNLAGQVRGCCAFLELSLCPLVPVPIRPNGTSSSPPLPLPRKPRGKSKRTGLCPATVATALQWGGICTYFVQVAGGADGTDDYDRADSFLDDDGEEEMFAGASRKARKRRTAALTTGVSVVMRAV